MRFQSVYRNFQVIVQHSDPFEPGNTATTGVACAAVSSEWKNEWKTFVCSLWLADVDIFDLNQIWPKRYFNHVIKPLVNHKDQVVNDGKTILF